MTNEELRPPVLCAGCGGVYNHAAICALEEVQWLEGILSLREMRVEIARLTAELAAANAVIAKLRSVASHEQIMTTWDQRLVKAGDN